MCLFEWNEDVYNEAERLIKEQGKCCLIIGTCLGKTSTALEYLSKHNCKALVLCPNTTIMEQWKDYDNVDVKSYQSFMNCYSKIDYTKYGIVICDEAHHLGADRWGEGVKYLLDNHILPVWGTTATEIRSDFDDVSESIFEGCKAVGLDVLTGIKTGILNGIKYVNSYYDTEFIKEDNKGLDNELLLKKLDLELNNTPTVQDILKTEMPNRNVKGIVFTADFEQMDIAENILNQAYPDIEIRKIHSKLEDNAENRLWFKNCTNGLIITVNMINEGSHYPGVNTIIMFRKLNSSPMYYQQIGRVMSLTKYGNPNAIVFDFVNNNKTISLIAALSSNKDIREKIIKAKPLSRDEKEELENELPSQIIIDDYTGSIDDILEDINNYKHSYWTEEEKQILYDYYPTEGMKCFNRLPQHAIGGCMSMVLSLGIRCETHYWTPEQDEIIKKEYPELGNTLKLKYPEFENKDLVSRARKLGVTYQPSCRTWTEEDDNLLRQLFENNSENATINASFPTKTNWSIWQRVKTLGLKKNKPVKVTHVKDETNTPIMIKCVETAEIFESASKAARAFNSYTSKIINCARNHCCLDNGYHFEFTK